MGLSSKVDRNSVRVSGSKGEATILEVSHNTRWESKTKDDGSELSALQRFAPPPPLACPPSLACPPPQVCDLSRCSCIDYDYSLTTNQERAAGHDIVREEEVLARIGGDVDGLHGSPLVCLFLFLVTTSQMFLCEHI